MEHHQIRCLFAHCQGGDSVFYSSFNGLLHLLSEALGQLEDSLNLFQFEKNRGWAAFYKNGITRGSVSLFFRFLTEALKTTSARDSHRSSKSGWFFLSHKNGIHLQMYNVAVTWIYCSENLQDRMLLQVRPLLTCSVAYTEESCLRVLLLWRETIIMAVLINKNR